MALETSDDRGHRLDAPTPSVQNHDRWARSHVEDATLLPVHLDEVVRRGDLDPLSGEVGGVTGDAGAPSGSYVASAGAREPVGAVPPVPS